MFARVNVIEKHFGRFVLREIRGQRDLSYPRKKGNKFTRKIMREGDPGTISFNARFEINTFDAHLAFVCVH